MVKNELYRPIFFTPYRFFRALSFQHVCLFSSSFNYFIQSCFTYLVLAVRLFFFVLRIKRIKDVCFSERNTLHFTKCLLAWCWTSNRHKLGLCDIIGKPIYCDISVWQYVSRLLYRANCFRHHSKKKRLIFAFILVFFEELLIFVIQKYLYPN